MVKRQEEIIKLQSLSLEEKAELGLYGMKKGDGVRLERLFMSFKLDAKGYPLLDTEKLCIIRQKQNSFLILEGKNDDGEDIATRAVVLNKIHTSSGYGLVFELQTGDKKTKLVTHGITAAEFEQYFNLADAKQQEEIQTALDKADITKFRLEKSIAEDMQRKKTLIQKGADLIFGPDYIGKRDAKIERTQRIANKQNQLFEILEQLRHLDGDRNVSVSKGSQENVAEIDNKIEDLTEASKKLKSDIRDLEIAPILTKSEKAVKKEAIKQRSENEAFLKKVRIPSADVLNIADNICKYGAQKNKDFMDSRIEKRKTATPPPVGYKYQKALTK